MSATVVVPCYNEADRLPTDAFVDFAGENPEFSFIFVDDGSTDGTAQVLKELNARAPDQFRVLTLGTNAGKAEAVRAGILSALETRTSEYFGFIDADLAVPLSQLILAHAAIGRPGTNAVIGARVKRLGARIVRRPARHYFGRVFATAVSMMLDLAVYDSQCGIKMFDRASATIAFSELFETRWLFDIEILIRLRSGFPDFDSSVLEMPLGEWTEKDGSKITAGSILKVPRDLLTIRRTYSREISSARRSIAAPQRSA